MAIVEEKAPGVNRFLFADRRSFAAPIAERRRLQISRMIEGTLTN